MATSALIGFTGFVGSNLDRQTNFNGHYNSKSIGQLAGTEYDLVVCSGARAEKWKINQDPDPDWASIEILMDSLAKARIRRLVLISTVDVYPNPIGVDEASLIEPTDHAQAYGRHRLLLEQFCREHFDTVIVRLPGLFGPGLKKNVIYDLLHSNQTEKINPDGSFQFYDLRHIWQDITTALSHNLDLVNFATAPVTVKDLAKSAFGLTLKGQFDQAAASYDMRSLYAELFGGHNPYLYSREQVLAELAQFVMEEKREISRI